MDADPKCHLITSSDISGSSKLTWTMPIALAMSRHFATSTSGAPPPRPGMFLGRMTGKRSLSLQRVAGSSDEQDWMGQSTGKAEFRQGRAEDLVLRWRRGNVAALLATRLLAFFLLQFTCVFPKTSPAILFWAAMGTASGRVYSWACSRSGSEGMKG